MKRNIVILKLQKETQLKCRGKGKRLILLRKHINRPTGGAGSPAKGNGSI